MVNVRAFGAHAMNILWTSLLYLCGLLAVPLAFNAVAYLLGAFRLVLSGLLRPKSFLTAFEYYSVFLFSAGGSALICWGAVWLGHHLAVSATLPLLLAFVFPGCFFFRAIPLMWRVAGRDSRDEKTDWKAEETKILSRYRLPAWTESFSLRRKRSALTRQCPRAGSARVASVPPPLPVSPDRDIGDTAQ